jgi:hypothetical protein
LLKNVAKKRKFLHFYFAAGYFVVNTSLLLLYNLFNLEPILIFTYLLCYCPAQKEKLQPGRSSAGLSGDLPWRPFRRKTTSQPAGSDH